MEEFKKLVKEFWTNNKKIIIKISLGLSLIIPFLISIVFRFRANINVSNDWISFWGSYVGGIIGGIISGTITFAGVYYTIQNNKKDFEREQKLRDARIIKDIVTAEHMKACFKLKNELDDICKKYEEHIEGTCRIFGLFINKEDIPEEDKREKVRKHNRVNNSLLREITMIIEFHRRNIILDRKAMPIELLICALMKLELEGLKLQEKSDVCIEDIRTYFKIDRKYDFNVYINMMIEMEDRKKLLLEYIGIMEDYICKLVPNGLI